MVLYSTQLIGFCLLFTLTQSTINDARIDSSIFEEFLVAQSSPESRELAKAVCKVGCLMDCLQNLQTKASKDNMVSRGNFAPNLLIHVLFVFIYPVPIFRIETWEEKGSFLLGNSSLEDDMHNLLKPLST